MATVQIFVADHEMLGIWPRKSEHKYCLEVPHAVLVQIFAVTWIGAFRFLWPVLPFHGLFGMIGYHVNDFH